MPNETDIDTITSKIEQSISKALHGTNDTSWVKWSEYVPKAIEGLSRDINRINDSREKALINVTELKIAVARIEKTLATMIEETNIAKRDFEEYKEKVILPLRTKVAVLAIISGFFGGVLAACVPVALRYLLKVPIL